MAKRRSGRPPSWTGSRAMAADGLPRYALGAGAPPLHLAQVRLETGELRFAGGGRDETVIGFASREALVALLARLQAARVPFASGQRVEGPAELARHLVDDGRLEAPLVEITWRAPGAWTLRELHPGALEWRVAEATQFACVDFDPATLTGRQGPA